MNPKELRETLVVGLSGLVVSLTLLLRGEGAVVAVPVASSLVALLVFFLARRWRRDE